MKVEATRFNIYYDTNDYKPLHHDSAALHEDKAKKQNFTVALSLGLTRTAFFEHAKNRATFEFDMPNGSVYCFASDFNKEWRHGIKGVPNDKY